MTDKTILEIFQQHFNGNPRFFRAPGRVNLIGEHTDYNDGFVFPMAIEFYTDIAISPRSDGKLNLWSENMQSSISLTVDSLKKNRHWSDYISGILFMLNEKGFKVPGADLAVKSQVPFGAGLSSSAALEVASALAFLSLSDKKMSDKDIAKLAQQVENQFVGMNCGIMDQFISVHGQKDRAMFLDCRSLDFNLVPLPSDSARIVVCNTMVKHSLGSSEYNVRRAECEQGVAIMQKSLGNIKALRDVNSEQLNSYQNDLPSVVFKRCRHVVTEDERTQQSMNALLNNDLRLFGDLMNASHDSLRDDYQVSCDELDVMVDLARSLPGVYGARMTGGGFGGCTVNLVSLDHVDSFVENIKILYKQKTSKNPDVYISSAAKGAHEFFL